MPTSWFDVLWRGVRSVRCEGDSELKRGEVGRQVGGEMGDPSSLS